MLFRSGNGGGGFLRAQLFRVGEHPFQELAFFRFDKFVDADLARFVGVAGEGGVDDDALAVTDDEQRRVVELQGVVGELLQRSVEVAARLLVFPAEVVALPDVGPALFCVRSATALLCATLEAVVVRVARLVDAEQLAEVVENAPARRRVRSGRCSSRW